MAVIKTFTVADLKAVNMAQSSKDTQIHDLSSQISTLVSVMTNLPNLSTSVEDGEALTSATPESPVEAPVEDANKAKTKK